MKYFSWENSIFKAEKFDGAYKYVSHIYNYSLDTSIWSVFSHFLRKLNNKNWVSLKIPLWDLI